jgi:hypothetical protein
MTQIKLLRLDNLAKEHNSGLENRDMEEFSTPIGKFRLVRLLGKGKSGYSHFAEGPEGPSVVKMMHDEPCDYYRFGNNKVESEIYAYKMLKEIGLNIPKLIYHDIGKKYLIKEFLDGLTAVEWLINSGDVNKILPELFSMAAESKKFGYNIDYFPTNFVIVSDRLYYVDYEINTYDPQWDLNNWGLYYWANTNGLAAYFESGDPLSINISTDSGQPITEPFKGIVSQWITKYSV